MTSVNQRSNSTGVPGCKPLDPWLGKTRDRKGISEILPITKIPLVANPHPLKIDPGIGLLRTLEGFSLVSGWPFPDNPLVSSRPVLSSRI